MELKENERIDDLECNGLKIIQNTEGFCFGIDSVLLADFAKCIKKGAKVIDLGTGSGIIATLLCSKTDMSKIIGVELQEQVCQMAKRSIALNKLENKFSILNANIKDLDTILEKENFDAIVTNPPYKKINTGIQNENKSKLIARHEVECNMEDIARTSSKLLKDKGELYIVHRAERLTEIIELLLKYKLEPKVLRMVQGNINTKPSLVLIKAVKNANKFLKVENTLFVYNLDGNYTDEIFKIYGKDKK